MSTTSHHNPDAVLNELTRALMFKVVTGDYMHFHHLLIQYYTVIVQGIACQQKGYILRGKITDPSGTAKLSFELEVSFNQMMTE